MKGYLFPANMTQLNIFYQELFLRFRIEVIILNTLKILGQQSTKK